MEETYRNLGIYSDLVRQARQSGDLYPLARPGAETQHKVRECLGWCGDDERAQDVVIEETWECDGVRGETITWATGYGPRTEAWLLRPASAAGPLPGVLALHDHGGFKVYGKEKIAEGPGEAPAYLVDYRQAYYGGRAWANALAKEGFTVLVHDTFLWGSRKFPVELMRAESGIIPLAEPAGGDKPGGPPSGEPLEVIEYNFLAAQHEHIVSKYLNLLGTGMPGVVCRDDRIALNYLHSRPDVLAGQVGCMGLSGGGNRAGMLRATAQGLKAAVVVGLMSTYQGLLDHNVGSHTWMLYPFAWARHGDWADLVACQAPAPLLVQYDLEDGLFTPAGMQAAHERLADHYRWAGAPEAYTGLFYPGPHKFDLPMQADAFAWLQAQLGAHG